MTTEHVISPDLWSLLGALLISLISGVISISRRIVQGQTVSVLWILSEFLSAMLCGWIAWDGYPQIQHYLPGWMTPVMFVAVAAHFGGRTFQTIEDALCRRYGIEPNTRR